MKNYWIVLLVFVMIACNSGVDQANEKTTAQNSLKGNWHFLDKKGNYNEAFFNDSSFQTINRFVKKNMMFKYSIRNDSLYTNHKKEKKGLTPIAGLEWLNENEVVISTEFVNDTLLRMPKSSNTMADIHPFKDSTLFFPAFYKRYEDYLLLKGIVTPEEVKKFREEGNVPDDVVLEKGQK